MMLAAGEGVPKDETEAVRWFRMAAEQDDADAQSLLGSMYALGRGVPVDYVEAYVWLSLAAARGVDAEEFAASVAKRMTREQIAAARKLVVKWTPQPTNE
jgi:TPR repeat protein